MDFFIIVFIIISIISAVAGKSKKVLEQQRREEEEAAMRRAEHNRRIAEQERQRRAAEEAHGGATIAPHVAPHVAPHAPTVHAMTESTDCEAHKKPESSEGSPVRAHAHTLQDKDCDTHAEPFSSEGESRQQHRERILKSKAERDAQLAMDARYDEADKKSRREAKIRQPEYEKTKLSFSENAILQGIIYSEILKPPMCKRRQ